ncbi:CCR4-NOT transcription complex subunit 8 [Cucumispora dikerogammari]|nr:CCR4-NOT transcription complex subunit 8 [Cucumispora dikerogammari]
MDHIEPNHIILDVWNDNLEEAIRLISEHIEFYNYVSIDTEFPGVLAKPVGNFSNPYIREYQKLRVNVDLLNIIQLGLTFSDSLGNKPHICTFQFNFAFNLDKEIYNDDSIQLLKLSAIDFQKHKTNGIPPNEFAFLLFDSGLMCEQDITWISFHSSYDFAYLLKITTYINMPKLEEGFYNLLNMNFKNIYDLKYLLRNTKYVKKGLQDISNEMGLKRIGVQHQAGSDSLLTSDLFFYIKKNLLRGNDEESKNEAIGSCKGKLYGLGNWEI